MSAAGVCADGRGGVVGGGPGVGELPNTCPSQPSVAHLRGGWSIEEGAPAQSSLRARSRKGLAVRGETTLVVGTFR